MGSMKTFPLLCGALWLVCAGPLCPAQDRDINRLIDAATVARYAGKFADAEELARDAVKRTEDIGASQGDRLRAFGALGLVYYREAKFDAADKMYRKALAIAEKQSLALEQDQLLGLLVQVEFARGRFSEAMNLLRKCEKIEDGLPEAAIFRQRSFTLSNLGAIQMAQRRLSEAERTLRKAIDLHQRAFGPNDPDGPDLVANLAEALRLQHRYSDSEIEFERALEMKERIRGPRHPSTALTLAAFGALRTEQRRFTDSEALFTKALPLLESALGPLHPHMALALHNLGCLYMLEHRYSEAEQAYSRALQIHQTLGPEHPFYAETLRGYAFVLRKLKRKSEAAELEKRAEAVARSAGRDLSGYTVDVSAFRQKEPR
jgi:tetratricopeptide (TPR) repeat protein